MAINVLPHDIWVIIFVPLVTSFVLNRAFGDTDGTRTRNLWSDSPVLYSIELRHHFGGTDRIRTCIGNKFRRLTAACLTVRLPTHLKLFSLLTFSINIISYFLKKVKFLFVIEDYWSGIGDSNPELTD